MGRKRRTDFLPGDKVLVQAGGQGPRQYTRAVVQDGGVFEETCLGRTWTYVWVRLEGSSMTVSFPIAQVRFRIWRPRQEG